MPTSVPKADFQPAADPGRPRVTAQRLVDNTIINGAASIVGLALSLVLLPVMVQGLGTAAFGIWALALSLTVSGGYLTLLDLGLQQSAVRLMSDARRLGNLPGLRGLFSTTLLVFVAVAGTVAAALVLSSEQLVELFAVEASLRDTAVLTFQLVGAHVLFDLPALAPRALLESDQRFLVVRAIELGRSAVLTVAIVVLLVQGYDLPVVAGASLVASALTASTYLLVAARSESGRFASKSLTRAQTRALLSFGGPVFVIRILSVIYRQMDKLILAVVVTLIAVAHYEIASRVQAGMIVLMGAVGAVLFPALTLLRDQPARLRELYLRGTSYFIALFLPAILVILVWAEPLIVGWVGTENADATPLVRLFYVWLALNTLDAVATTMLMALGRLRQLVWCTASWVVANLLLSVLLVGPLGAPGVLVGSVVTYVPLIAAYTLLCIRELDIGLAEWFRRVIRPNIPGTVVQSAVLVALLRTPLSAELPGLAAVAIIGLVTYPLSLAIYVRIGLAPDDRKHFIDLVKSTFLRRRAAPG